jgi:hypothetical protein
MQQRRRRKSSPTDGKEFDIGLGLGLEFAFGLGLELTRSSTLARRPRCLLPQGEEGGRPVTWVRVRGRLMGSGKGFHLGKLV